MTIDEAKFIVTVLTYQHGFADPVPKIDRELSKIRDRYRELKLTRGFEESAKMARAEWLTAHMETLKQNSEVTQMRSP